MTGPDPTPTPSRTQDTPGFVERRIAPTSGRSLTPRGLPRLRGRTPLPRDQVRLSVLIPVYNEQDTIEMILDQVHAVLIPKEVICVNDRSTDGTAAVLEQQAARGRIDKLIHHPVNRGKGAATGRACSSRFSTAAPTPYSARGSSADRIACSISGTPSAISA